LKELTDLALDAAGARGAAYADVRVVRRRTQRVEVRDGVVGSLTDAETLGFGMRVIVNGAWGFAASSRLDRRQVERTAAEAVEIARASATVGREPVDLGPPEVHVDTYHTPFEMDLFDVSIETKIALLMQADEAMRRACGVHVTRGSVVCWRENKTLASSEGSFIEQEIVETGGGIVAYAVGGGEMQQRSYPNSFARDQRTGGWEVVEAMDLPGNGERLAEEAVALLTADATVPGGLGTFGYDDEGVPAKRVPLVREGVFVGFQFGTEIAYEIRNGRLGCLLKNPTYTGMPHRFWGSCDAICNKDHWRVCGMPNCGKGQPSQVAHTGHGTAPARFRNVQVGGR